MLTVLRSGACGDRRIASAPRRAGWHAGDHSDCEYLSSLSFPSHRRSCGNSATGALPDVPPAQEMTDRRIMDAPAIVPA